MAEKRIPQNLDDRPALVYLNRHVKTQLSAACANNPLAWKDLGAELLPNSGVELGNIAANNPTVIERCASVFSVWLERVPEASWRKLIKAMNNIGLNNLASQIEQMFEPSVDTTHKSTATSAGPSNQESVLTQEAQMWELTEIVVPRVMAKWESLAYCMRYTPEEVSAFNKDGKDSKECCTKLLTNWLTTGHEPKPKTYQILLKYIKKISDLAAASEAIEKELIKTLQDD